MTPTTRTRSGEALSRCVDPVEVGRFLDEHWERRPLVVDRDEPGRFDDLLTPDDVERLLESGGLRSPAFRLVRADERLKAAQFVQDVSWRPVPFTGMPNVAKVAAEFERGATLVVQGMHHWWPPLAAFCHSLEADLGHRAQANAYFTPRAAQGLPVHHDTHDVFCLQLAGEKRWLVYEPVWELPLREQKYDSSLGEPGDAVLDVKLRPGDTLYLPRGWLHAATTSDEESLHLTIGVNVYTWRDAFRAALDECSDDVAFRRSTESADAEPLLAALAQRLRPADVARRRRRKLITSRRPVLEGQFDALRSLDALDIDSELERRATVLAELDGTRLLFEGTTLEFPEHVRAELEFVLAADAPFRPSDLPGGLDDESRLAFVRRLVREGVLRPAR